MARPHCIEAKHLAVTRKKIKGEGNGNEPTKDHPPIKYRDIPLGNFVAHHDASVFYLLFMAFRQPSLSVLSSLSLVSSLDAKSSLK